MSSATNSGGGIPLDALLQLADSASEVVVQRSNKNNGKVRVEMKSEEDRIRKRQLRLLKNRQSAALSRQRKKEYISDLEVKATGLCTDKSDLEGKINRLTSLTLDYKLQVDRLEKQLHEANQENNELKTKLAFLTQGPPQQVESQQRQHNSNNINSNNINNTHNNTNNTTSTPSTHFITTTATNTPNITASYISNTNTSMNNSINISSPSLSALVKPAPALAQERIFC